MGSGQRKVSWTLCFLLLLLLEAASPKSLWERALPSRLAERSRVSAQVRAAGAGEVGSSCPHTRAGRGRRFYLNCAKVGWQADGPHSPQKALCLGIDKPGPLKTHGGDSDGFPYPRLLSPDKQHLI